MTELDHGRALMARLKRREPLLVVNIDYSNGSLVEFLGRNGADVLFIDCEQGDTSIESIPDLVRAAHMSATPVLVRLFSPEPWVIERHLLRGVDGIVVPRLETAAQVRAAVEAVDYCRPGGRDRTVVVIQIETVAAACNLDAILAVEGIDALFIGPLDLAKSMGHGADYGASEVVAEIDRLIRKIVGSGHAVGMLVTEASIARFAAKGVSFLYLHANDFLKVGAAAFVAARNSGHDGMSRQA